MNKHNGKTAQFIISSSPHLKNGLTSSQIMFQVLVALLPAVIASCFFFGIEALRLILTCLLTSVITEAAWQSFRRKDITVSDGSALVTGLLLALTLPPGLSSGLASLGSVVAISVGKQAFGGLGHNPFNPALVGRAFLLISFPVQMTDWPDASFIKGGSVFPPDASTGATPLDLLEENIITEYSALFWGNVNGSLGETSAFALLLGGLYLWLRGFLHWRITVGLLGSVAVLTALEGSDPLFHLLSGGVLLGAFFMATDMVTSPLTYRGHWIFGTGTGVLIWLIRLHGGYPEGVTFAILLMNMTVPLLDYNLVPRSFGESRRKSYLSRRRHSPGRR